MKSPFTGGKAILATKTRKAIFRKEEHEYTHLYYRCADTQETFTTTQANTFNTWQIYDNYRSAHGIPYSDAMKEMRSRCRADKGAHLPERNSGIHSCRQEAGKPLRGPGETGRPAASRGFKKVEEMFVRFVKKIYLCPALKKRIHRCSKEVWVSG